MNRLTKKDIEGAYDFTYSNGEFVRGICPLGERPNQEIYVNGLNKLGKLEDLEEELGIDFITLFNALKDGIYKKGRNNLKGYILFDNCPMLSFVHKTISCELIEDYGKTWALTREELEE